VARFRRRAGRRSGKSSRKTHWTWTGIRASASLDVGEGGDPEYFSAWVRYPSGFIDPRIGHVMPSDETLVRMIVNANVLFEGSDLTTAPTSPVHACIGFIAHDGGHDPATYDAAVWAASSLGAPPHPLLDADFDWTLRLPFIFTATKSFQGPGDRIFIESRAMRKLPPQTGILMVFGPLSIGGVANNPKGFDLGIDCRQALRSGYTF